MTLEREIATIREQMAAGVIPAAEGLARIRHLMQAELFRLGISNPCTGRIAEPSPPSPGTGMPSSTLR